MKNQSNRFLAITTTLCFMMAGSSLYGFYCEHAAIVSNGQCLKVTFSGLTEVTARVQNNDFESGLCSLIVKGLPTLPETIINDVPVKELRNSGAQKVECE